MTVNQQKHFWMYKSSLNLVLIAEAYSVHSLSSSNLLTLSVDMQVQFAVLFLAIAATALPEPDAKAKGTAASPSPSDLLPSNEVQNLSQLKTIENH